MQKLQYQSSSFIPLLNSINDCNSGTELAASSSKCHSIFDDIDNDGDNNDDYDNDNDDDDDDVDNDDDEFTSPISCHSAAPQFADEC